MRSLTKKFALPLLVLIKRAAILSALIASSSQCHAVENSRHIVESNAIDIKNHQCPTQNFQKFLTIFSERIETQRAFTKFPLTVQRIDVNAEPEPKPVILSLEKSQINFPVIPNGAERKKKSLKLRIDSNNDQEAKVTLWKEDTGYQVLYLFTRDACWMLGRIEDWSL